MHGIEYMAPPEEVSRLNVFWVKYLHICRRRVTMNENKNWILFRCSTQIATVCAYLGLVYYHFGQAQSTKLLVLRMSCRCCRHLGVLVQLNSDERDIILSRSRYRANHWIARGIYVHSIGAPCCSSPFVFVREGWDVHDVMIRGRV
jgi:hypothetical protein